MSLIKIAMPKGPHLDLPINHLKEDHKELEKLETDGKKVMKLSKNMMKEDKEGLKKYFVKSEKDEK